MSDTTETVTYSIFFGAGGFDSWQMDLGRSWSLQSIVWNHLQPVRRLQLCDEMSPGLVRDTCRCSRHGSLSSASFLLQ